MTNTAIRVENLGKKYILSHQQNTARYKTFSEAIIGGAKSLIKPFQHPSSIDHPYREEFWALKDISFEIQQGDRVGIIGRNGAGKSTLLKILSRITEPTKGRVDIKGRVASLLEVGTGFHPELTGRENIYLNGAILGMSRAEIKRKFDEIVDFAEVEKFLDTPVKRYSSGMYVRLAFAVAAYLEPEILIVDEVLAVGDAQFQKKCLGKMGEVTQEGRTVLFVSHQMAAISNLCSSCILLQSGKIGFYGKTDQAIQKYLETSSHYDQSSQDLQFFRPSWAKPLITALRILDSQEREQKSFPLDADITIEMTFKTQDVTRLKTPVMGIVVNHITCGTVGAVNSRWTGFEIDQEFGISATMRCAIRNAPFLQGEYSIDVWLGDGSADLDTVTGYLKFQVEETDVYGTGHPPLSHLGVIFLKPQWQYSNLKK